MDGIVSPEKAERIHTYGGKAAGLAFLEEHGFRTPPFYVIGYDTLSQVIEGKMTLEQLVEDWQINNHISEDSLWAVRSSASIEDGNEKSFAGLFNSQINVSPAGMKAAIQQVLAAFEEVKQLNYEVSEDFSFGIVVQQMILSEYSGVIFSHNPLDPSEAVAHLNIVPGLGENLVSGKAEAFMVHKEGRKITYLNTDDDFTGDRYDGELIPLTVSGQKMQQILTPFIKQLFKGVEKLARLKGYPVDCEFTMADGVLYWLQIRPITSSAVANPIAIYDNANIGENYPGLTMPLSISFIRRTYEQAYSAMNDFLGTPASFLQANRDRLSHMVDGIYGKMYYRVTSWQQLLYQLPFGKKTSKLLIKLWNMDESPFEKPERILSHWDFLRLFGNLIKAFFSFNRLKTTFDALYEKEMNGFHPSQIEDLDHAGLVAFYQDFEQRLGANWVVPVLNGFYAMLTWSALKWVFRRSRLAKSHPNFINDILFAQGDVISVQIVKNFQALTEEIQQSDALLQLFQQAEDQTVLNTLERDFPAFKTKIDDYLWRFGERVAEGELKMETTNYRDDPRLFIAFLRESTAVKVKRKTDTSRFHYREVLKQEYAYRPLKRWLLNTLIKRSIPRIRDRENYRFFRTKSFAIARTVFRQMGHVLTESAILEEQEDFLYLEFEELMNPTLSTQYKSIVKKRRQEYEYFGTVEHAARYLQTKNGLIPEEKSSAELALKKLKGTGCCSGVVSGKVVMISGPKLDDENHAGEIFVAHHFEPGWINLFAQAGGVISERGNLLSHTAILCREMGIPSIVGVKGLTAQIKAGDHIQMNGATGEIFLLDKMETET